MRKSADSKILLLLLAGLFACLDTVLAQSTDLKLIDSLFNESIKINMRDQKEKINSGKEVIRLSKLQNYDLGVARAARMLGKVFYYYRENEVSKTYHRTALKYFQAAGDSLGIADSYSNLGNVLAKLGKIDSSIINHEISAEILLKTGHIPEACTELASIGLRYLRSGQYNNSEKYLLHTLKLREELKDTISLATNYNNLGVLYWRWGRLQNALNMYETSIDLRRKIKNFRGQVLPKLNIGLILIDLMDLKYAEEYLIEGLASATEFDYLLGKATANLYLAELYLKKEDLEKSAFYAENAVEIYKELNNPLGRIRATNYIAKKFIGKREYDNAEKILLEALSDLAEYPKSQVGPEINYSLALLEYEKGNFLKAEKYINNSLSAAEPVLNIQKDIYLLAAKVYENLGRNKTSVVFFENYIYLADSIYNKQIVDVVSNWRVKYETTRKENEILKLKEQTLMQESEITSQLNIRNILILSFFSISIIAVLLFRLYRQKNNLIIEIEKQKEELSRSNETKSKLFSIISHDLKNPFLSLMGLTEQLVTSADEMTKEEIKESAEVINSASQKLNRLSQNLLDWARINTDRIEAKPAKNDIGGIADQVLEELNAQIDQKEIYLEKDFEENLFCLCDKDMISTIIRNLLSNAVKFSKNGGRVVVKTERSANLVTFSVQDFGIGIDKETGEKLFDSSKFHSAVGTNKESGSGLGLLVCQEFAKMNGSELSFSSDAENGTIFKFSVTAM